MFDITSGIGATHGSSDFGFIQCQLSVCARVSDGVIATPRNAGIIQSPSMLTLFPSKARRLGLSDYHGDLTSPLTQ